MQTHTEREVNEITLNVAIGHEVFKLFNLKINAKGKIKTERGEKTIQGIGATILNIITEQKERLK
jgi:hypothetical protein